MRPLGMTNSYHLLSSCAALCMQLGEIIQKLALPCLVWPLQALQRQALLAGPGAWAGQQEALMQPEPVRHLLLLPRGWAAAGQPG